MAIVAETLEDAEEAEKGVEITYKKLPVVSNIQEAIECKAVLHEDHPDNIVSTTCVQKAMWKKDLKAVKLL